MKVSFFKYFILICLPLVLMGANAKLITLVDGDTAVFEYNGKEFSCHLGDMDSPEHKFNNKLKKELEQCHIDKKSALSAGEKSYKFAKTLLHVKKSYTYEIKKYFPNKYPICTINLPKGLNIELRPKFGEVMITQGYALPYIIGLDPTRKSILLKMAKSAKSERRGLWKEHANFMQCLINNRYSLKELRE